MTINNETIKTNKLLNGETVSYTLFTAISVFLLFTIKQFCKIVLSLDSSTSVLIGFIIAEIVSFLFEKRFVFRKKILSSNFKQICFFIFRAGVDYGFYLLSIFLFDRLLKVNTQFAWLAAITICFFFNYFFDRLLVFDCVYKPESVKNSKIYRTFYEYRYVIYAPFVTIVCLFTVFLIFRAFPFGDSTVMRMDLYHQYGPLFAELYDRVVNFQSFFYSWTSGGGSSFLGNFFNYLSSPLSALIFLFDKKDISFAITFIVTIKCLLSAGTFSYYLKASQKANDIYSTCFGVLYATSAYFLAYYWNVMWLEGMFLFPIILLGIERLVDNGKVLTYIFSLALLLYSSYYMGFMACIFSVMYYFGYCLLSSNGKEVIDKSLKFKNEYSFKALNNKKFFNRTFKFGLSSLAAGGLCAVTLIPVFIILRASSATSDEFPSTFESYFNIFDFITSHLAGLETTIRSSGDDVLPNIYSGILTIILVPLYIVNSKIRVKEKAVYVILSLFLLISFNNNCLNFIWHGLHFPNDLPFRFSFMYTFLILIMGYRCIKKLDKLEIRDIGFVGMAWIFFIIVAQKMATTKMSGTTIYVSIAFVILWTAFLYIVKNNKLDKFLLSATALVLVFCEVIISCTISVHFTQNNTDYKVDYETYTSAINKIHSTDKDFYREELCYLEKRMDPCYFGYNGISTFSSMAYEDYSTIQYNLGMFGNRINSYSYNTQTPIYNMMFNIKYLIYKDVGTKPSDNLYTYIDKSEDEKCSIYQNDYFLPIAYCVNNKLNDWITEEGNPFELQESYFELSTGYSNVYKPVEFIETDFDNMTGDTVNENGTYWFSKTNGENSYGYVNITFKTVKNGNAYIYVTSPDITEISFNSDRYDEKIQQIEEPYILDLGYYKAGEEITMSVDFSSVEEEETSAEIYAYTCDEDVLKLGYEKLKDSSLDVSSHNDTTIIGTIKAKENCWLYTSIPYDESWTLTVDGEETEIFKIGNSMLGAAIKPGEHEIQLKYTPRGISYGAIISVLSLTGIIAYVIFDKRKQKNDKISDSISTSN